MQFVKANRKKQSSRRFPCDCHFCVNWLLPIAEVSPTVRPNQSLSLNVPSSSLEQSLPLVDLTEMSSGDEETITQVQVHRRHHTMSSSDEEPHPNEREQDPLATTTTDEEETHVVLKAMLEEETSAEEEEDEDAITIEERPTANTQEVFDNRYSGPRSGRTGNEEKSNQTSKRRRKEKSSDICSDESAFSEHEETSSVASTLSWTVVEEASENDQAESDPTNTTVGSTVTHHADVSHVGVG